MGYESKVTIVLRKMDADEIAKNLLSTCNKKLTDVFSRIGTLKSPDETYVCLQTDWTKWYKYFPEVDLIINYIKDVRHSYIRCGEDCGDMDFSVKAK